ncbi:MAG: hypothetical protein RL367_2209 [Pseudomonadota bacterium]
MINGGVASIYVTDMDRALVFYTGILGLSLRSRIADEWAEIDAGNGLTIGLHIAHPPESAAAGSVGAINVELHVDQPMEQVVATLTGRGAGFEGEIANFEHVRIATVRDPDGNLIVLAETIG